MAAILADTVLDVAKEIVKETEDSPIITSGGVPFSDTSGGAPNMSGNTPINTSGGTPYINTSGS